MSGSSPAATPTNTDFRIAYPEFADTTTYPDVMVNIWLTVAINQLDACRWADLYSIGCYLFAGHNLALSRRNVIAAAGGGATGSSGLINQKTLGRASVGIDTENGSVKNGGPWNLTTYGTQLLWYAQMVGSGGIQFTGPMVSPGLGQSQPIVSDSGVMITANGAVVGPGYGNDGGVVTVAPGQSVPPGFWNNSGVLTSE